MPSAHRTARLVEPTTGTRSPQSRKLWDIIRGLCASKANRFADDDYMDGAERLCTGGDLSSMAALIASAKCCGELHRQPGEHVIQFHRRASRWPSELLPELLVNLPAVTAALAENRHSQPVGGRTARQSWRGRGAPSTAEYQLTSLTTNRVVLGDVFVKLA